MDASLERLDLKYVDLIYAHRPDRRTPMEETVRAFNHLINNGKALYWGTSEWSADEIAQAWRYCDRLGLIGPVMEQPTYNMLDRDRVEREYSHLYREVGLGLTVYSPLARGVLSGKYRDGIPPNSRFAQLSVDSIRSYWQRTERHQWESLVHKATMLEPVAQSLNTSLGCLALAWVIKNPNVSTAIMGASSPDQIIQNLQALEVMERLTPEIMKKIDDILGNKPAEYPLRYPCSGSKSSRPSASTPSTTPFQGTPSVVSIDTE